LRILSLIFQELAGKMCDVGPHHRRLLA
jgi:hypothetical protein